MKRFEHQLFK